MRLLKILPLFLLVMACTPKEIIVNNNPSDLLEKRWLAKTITEIATKTVQEANSDQISLNFLEENSVRAILSANSCAGAYKATAANLTVTFNACTEMCCDSDFDKLLQGILRGNNSYRLKGNSLEIIGTTHIIKLESQARSID